MTSRDDSSLKTGPPAAPPGTHFMSILRWALLAFVIVLAVVSVGSYVMSRHRTPAAKQQTETKLLYQCPMHPSYTSEKPGECPICGMTLEPVRAPDAHADHVSAGHESNVPGLTSVHITPERVQLIGVRTARVERSSLGGQLDLVGFVTPDESRLKRVQIRVSGWIRRLYVNQTGKRVNVGQPLLSIYSPELLQTEQEYRIERSGGDSASVMRAGGEGGSAAQRLRLLAVPDEEIRRLEKERTPATELILHSPAGGTVLERGVVEGQYVGADTPLLTLADLSRVWVIADLYEMDFTRVRVGDLAHFTADALLGRSFGGSVQFIYPTVSSETRTLKVRLALDNRDGSLRPGMYGRVRVSGRGASALSVPGEAVVNTGEHSYVFLAHEGGHFEPRMVWTGMPEGDLVQILKGLAAGDTVVTSASFLIDSESRLKAAIAGMGAQTGMPGMNHSHGGTP